MTHIKEGLAPLTPETSAETGKRRKLGSPTPRAAESWENRVSETRTAFPDGLLQNFC